MKKTFALIISMLSGREIKTRLFVLSLLWATVLPMESRAQYSDYYYHRVGDTIEWKSEIGYYSWWEWKEFYEQHLPTYIRNIEGEVWAMELDALSDSGIILERFYTPTPLKIIGIAGVSYRGRYKNVGGQSRWESDTSSAKDYFLIYDAIGDSFPLVSQTEWSPYDTMRTLHITTRWHIDSYTYILDSCCAGTRTDSRYLPLKEYYFENPVYVSDSFYVGGTFYGGLEVNLFNDELVTLYAGAYFEPVSHPCDEELQQVVHISSGASNGCVPQDFPIMKYKGFRKFWSKTAKSQSFHSCPWNWTLPFTGVCLMIYPIIEVDTTVPPGWACDTIENVQVTVSGSSATVTWDGFPNYSRILLRYGRRNEPPSQWRQEDVTGSTLHTLTGLPPSSMWGVSLMAECDTNKKETPWSAPTYFFVPDDTTGGGTQGIDEGTTQLARLTFLQPNPATDQVLVTSSFGLSEIELWTVDGVMVYHAPHTGHEASIDVSWLRAGTYIMAIHTHNGTTHKRLLKL